MHTSTLTSFLEELRGEGASSDRELLDRFNSGDETAFASLVRRHGPMVLGVNG